MNGMFIIAGAIAAAVAWSLNCLLLKLVSQKAVFISPAVEETAKTVAAVLLGAPIALTHLVFGLIEAVWDMYHSRCLGPVAAWLSAGGHWGFGLVAEQIYTWQHDMAYSVGGGILVHLFWNWVVRRVIKA